VCSPAPGAADAARPLRARSKYPVSQGLVVLAAVPEGDAPQCAGQTRQQICRSVLRNCVPAGGPRGTPMGRSSLSGSTSCSLGYSSQPALEEARCAHWLDVPDAALTGALTKLSACVSASMGVPRGRCLQQEFGITGVSSLRRLLPRSETRWHLPCLWLACGGRPAQSSSGVCHRPEKR
jgi:hypothetical protein